MIGKAEALPMGATLTVSFEECEWFIQIHRIDRKVDNRFLDLNQKEVGSEQIAKFVPNWANLEWQHAVMEGIAKEAYIQDGDYRLYLICLKEASVNPDTAIQEFKAFMKA